MSTLVRRRMTDASRYTSVFNTGVYSLCMSFATEPEVTPTTPRRRTARREATRRRILSAAEDVFAERGFHGASVEDICERAEFTRGAFYSNFASKDELVLELFQQHVTRLQAAIAEVAARPELPL